MALTRDAPSDSRYSHFLCEEAVVIDVNRSTWTCTVQTVYSAKTKRDLRWCAPYLHFKEGEGIHFMPEVGAHCYVASPVDNTPSFVLCFVAPPAASSAKGQDASGENAVSYQANRPDLNPGDIALTTRDGNFLILRRGGIVQLGATPMAQRIVVPVRNFVRDYCENYELVTPSGEMSWIIDRPELDAAGQAPSSWSFALQEFATDTRATVRVRHLPLADAGKTKSAWEVMVAPQGIDRSTGAVSSATYSFTVLVDGSCTEMIGASRSTHVKGDDALTIDGNQSVSVQGRSELSASAIALTAANQTVIDSPQVKLGGGDAFQPAVLGQALVEWLSSAIIQTAKGGPGTFSPASIAKLPKILSRVVAQK